MRPPHSRLLFAAVPAAGLALIGAGGVASSQGTSIKAEAELGPYTTPHAGVIVDAGVTGKARTVTRDERSIVRLKAKGLAPRAAYGVHLHNGRCSDFGPHFKFDPAGPGTRDNEVWLDLQSNHSGEAHDRVTVRPLPTGQTYSIVIHALSNPDRAPAGEPGHPGPRIACGDLKADAGGDGTVFVTERQLGSVSALDARSGAAIWTQMVGAGPIGVTQPHGTDKVYTSDEGPDQVSVLDRETGAPAATIPMGPDPHHLMASRNGKHVFVAEFGSNTIGVVDTSRDERIAGYVASTAASARTHAVWITRDGSDLYATVTRADRAQPGDVAKLDARTGELLCTTTVGADPSEILATPNGRLGYVSVRRENKVKELDLTGHCPVLTGREAVVGTQPDTLQLSKGGSMLVVALRGTPAQISLIDTHSFAVRQVDIPGHTTTGHQWLSANGKLTYVAVESRGGLAVVDNKTGTTVADYPYPNPPGSSRPHGVFYEPSRVGGR